MGGPVELGREGGGESEEGGEGCTDLAVPRAFLPSSFYSPSNNDVTFLLS